MSQVNGLPLELILESRFDEENPCHVAKIYFIPTYLVVSNVFVQETTRKVAFGV
jgi:hypothetical protein